MMHTLVMLSGGPDSVAAAWKAAEAGPVTLVHVRLSWHAGARRAEGRAARAAAAWIAAHARGPVSYLELAHIVPRELVAAHDMRHLAWPRAALLAARPDIAALARCAVAEDVATGWETRAEWYRAVVERSVREWRADDWCWTDPLGWPPPPKHEVLADMPAPLRRIAVSCRAPSSAGEPCGECFKCLGDGTAIGTAQPTHRLGPVHCPWDAVLTIDEQGHLGRDVRRLPPRSVALLPHPTGPALALALAYAAQIRRDSGSEIRVHPLWLPPLPRLLSAEALWKARQAALPAFEALFRSVI